MNKHETGEVVMYVAKVHRSMESDADTMRVWHALLSDLDGPTTLKATMSLLRKPSAWPPTPGQIRAEVERLDGNTLPTEQAALGYFMTGQWTVHPAVERAAKAVHYDRHECPQEAIWDFKSRYAAELDREDNGHVRPAVGTGTATRLDPAAAMRQLAAVPAPDQEPGR